MRTLTSTEASRIVAAFGVGLAGAAAGTNAEAAVISLTPSPGVVTGAYGGGTTNVRLGDAGSFIQFNNITGKTLLAYTIPGGTTYGYYFPPFGIAGFNVAPASQTITVDQPFTSVITVARSATGTRTYGFKTALNQVGWLKVNFGGAGGPVTYLAAAYNDTPGGSIHSGSGPSQPVPEPTLLALAALSALALGSRGVAARRGR